MHFTVRCNVQVPIFPLSRCERTFLVVVVTRCATVYLVVPLFLV